VDGFGRYAKLLLGFAAAAALLFSQSYFEKEKLERYEYSVLTLYAVLGIGALSSGLLLYGASLVYGFTGSLEFSAIAASVMEQGATPGIVAGMVFLLCGLAFKISAAPFHMWTPDVYEGSPTPVTGFFSAAPKFAAMALIARVLVGPFEGITASWQQVIVVISVLSMAVGALGALRQTNIKRLMAYSSHTSNAWFLW